MILVSTKHIPEELVDRIHKCMGDFLRDSSYEDLKMKFKRNQYDWSAFTSIVKLLYVRSSEEVISQGNSVCATMKDLYVFSLRSAILAFRVMITREEHKQLLFKEKLSDFICCAPFHLPEELKAEAKDLVKEIGCLQPPSLLNIVRSKLAKLHYGLKSILEKSVAEIVMDLSAK